MPDTHPSPNDCFECVAQRGRRSDSIALPEAVWRYRIRVLGEFEIRDGGEPLSLQGKPLELLQALIAFGASQISVSSLVDALWPDLEADAGYHAFESTLHRLRKALRTGDLLQLTGSKMSIDRRRCWVDLWEFAEHLRSNGAPEAERLARFSRARALYRGHLLDRETDYTWVLRPRQILRNRFVRAVREEAEIHERQRHWRAAVRVYESALELDIVAEDLSRQLMSCLCEVGEFSAALQIYQDLRELLRSTLGIAPNPKTQALHLDVKRRAAQGSALRVSAGPLAAGYAPAMA